MSDFDLEADAEAVVQRARELCEHHRIIAAVGCCRECMMRAIEEHIAEAHPEMKRGDVFDLVQEWLLRAGEPSLLSACFPGRSRLLEAVLGCRSAVGQQAGS